MSYPDIRFWKNLGGSVFKKETDGTRFFQRSSMYGWIRISLADLTTYPDIQF
jgi:hypothetical protein